MIMPYAWSTSCQEATFGDQQGQLVELAATMESLLEEDRELYRKMEGLMKKRNVNDGKMARLIERLNMISGGRRSKIAGGFELDENENDTSDKCVGNNSEAKSSAASKSPRGLVGCIASISRCVMAGIFSFLVEKSGINMLLGFFGVMIRPLENMIKVEKRKRIDIETVDDYFEVEEAKLKRWRPDLNHVVDFEDMNGKKTGVDIDSYWNKKPNISFVNNKVTGVKTISDSEDLIRDLTPKSKKSAKAKMKIVVEDTDELNGTEPKISEALEDVVLENRLMIEPSDSFGDNINKDLTGYIINSVETSTPLLDQVPGLFVFSGIKPADPIAAAADITAEELAEQSMLSGMTFQEKKVYFAEKIKDEEAAAMRGSCTPMKLNVSSKSPLLPRLGVKDSSD